MSEKEVIKKNTNIDLKGENNMETRKIVLVLLDEINNILGRDYSFEEMNQFLVWRSDPCYVLDYKFNRVVGLQEAVWEIERQGKAVKELEAIKTTMRFFRRSFQI